MAFDINERDATGQNILYVTSLLGNKKLLDVILKFKVKATRIQLVCKIDFTFKFIYDVFLNDLRNLIQLQLQRLTQ